MGEKKRKIGRLYALLIIAVLVLSIGGSIAYFRLVQSPELPVCEAPPTPPAATVHGSQSVRIGDKWFTYANVTFYSLGQLVVIGSPSDVVFRVVYVFDPSRPHLVGRECVTDLNAPTSLILQLSFKDGSSEEVPITYGGNPPLGSKEVYASHTNPQALLRWYPNDPYIVVLAETPQSA